MPVCLPEQLWCRRLKRAPGSGVMPLVLKKKGTWLPQARLASPAPILASSAAARSTCMGSPLWLAHSRATSASLEFVAVGRLRDQRHGLKGFER